MNKLNQKLLAASVALTSGAVFASEEVVDPIQPLDIMANIDISGVTAMQDKVILVMVGVCITGLVYHIFKRFAR
ncbi:hypothetical protein QRT07_09900 [Vibrio parahaemolyticus]|uniref:hypothetical protein n=1 Tax=Vibrio parahaemolyticus TaxID=670 RepID=UPI00257020BF|nr:hypothetical protein [Vibrio parahaemolyticus]WJE02889.1 hypothetical protein QRT07_09900 [Vibrio parahaemolyticus]